MKMLAAVATGPGLVRSVNQDNFYLNGIWRHDTSDQSIIYCTDISSGEGVYAVADGIGGGICGERASLMAVEMLNTGRDDFCNAVLSCSNDIAAEARQHGDVMGSTFAGVLIRDNQAVVSNVGDSRIYLFRDGVLEQLSCDHTGTALLVELGFLSRAEARKHPDGHKLTQYLGVSPEEMLIEPFTNRIPILDGDSLLLCSDGLSDMLTDEEIEETLKQSAGSEESVQQLFKRAEARGACDNITVLIVRIERESK